MNVGDRVRVKDIKENTAGEIAPHVGEEGVITDKQKLLKREKFFFRISFDTTSQYSYIDVGQWRVEPV